MTETPIKCSCGKLIARERDGKIFVWCKSCHKEVEIKIEKASQYEPELEKTTEQKFKRRF